MSSYRAFHGWILILAFVLAACSPPPSSSSGSSSAAVAETQTAPAAGDTSAGVLADMPPNLDGYRDLRPDQVHALLEQTDVALVNVHVP